MLAFSVVWVVLVLAVVLMLKMGFVSVLVLVGGVGEEGPTDLDRTEPSETQQVQRVPTMLRAKPDQTLRC